jgi:16S rRNA processing protein RimM
VTSPLDEELVQVGTIGKPHGLRGEVVIHPATDFPHARFAPGATLLVRRGEALDTLTIVSARFHKDRPLVTFTGVTTIEQAEALGRPALWVRAADRPAAPDGQFYHDALIGCRVETVAGDAIGAVTRIDETGGVPLLVVGAEHGAARDEVLIPLAEAICRVIDPAARRIVIDPPDGLLDVNRR